MHLLVPGVKSIIESVLEVETELEVENVVSKSSGFVIWDSGVLFGLGSLGGGDGGMDATMGGAAGVDVGTMGVRPGVAKRTGLEKFFEKFGGDLGYRDANRGTKLVFGVATILVVPPIFVRTADVGTEEENTVVGPSINDVFRPIKVIRGCSVARQPGREFGEPANCCTTGTSR